MNRLLQISGGILLAILLVVFALVRLAFEVIGASTAPDDFALLRERMPAVLNWLFTTSWIVPTILVLGLACLAAWLLYSGLRGAAATESGEPALDHDAVLNLVRAELGRLPAPAGDRSENSHVQQLHSDVHMLRVEWENQIASVGAQIGVVSQRLNDTSNVVEGLLQQSYVVQCLASAFEMQQFLDTAECREGHFEEIKARISSDLNALSNFEAGRIDQLPDEIHRMDWDSTVGAIRSYFDALDEYFRNTLREALQFGDNPNYDKNHERKASGDENFSNPEFRQEYRRLHDQVSTGLKRADALQAKLKEKRRETRTRLADLVPHINGLLKPDQPQ